MQYRSPDLRQEKLYRCTLRNNRYLQRAWEGQQDRGSDDPFRSGKRSIKIFDGNFLTLIVSLQSRCLCSDISRGDSNDDVSNWNKEQTYEKSEDHSGPGAVRHFRTYHVPKFFVASAAAGLCVSASDISAGWKRVFKRNYCQSTASDDQFSRIS